jgi:hypothetical protein
MPFVYVFHDPGVPTACKVGKSATLISRYKQARAHTPRGIAVNGFFEFSDASTTRGAEAAAHRVLNEVRREGDAREWFDVPGHEAIERLLELPEFQGAKQLSITPALKGSAVKYDDWREARSSYNRYKWRLFLFQEQSAQRSLKLSYGALYATAYSYAFTYNPYPVRLVAGFDDPCAPESVDFRNEEINQGMSRCWQQLQSDWGDEERESVGWLRDGIQPSQVAARLREFGFKAFDLFRPLPSGVLEREASVPQHFPGATLPCARILPAQDVF